MMLSLMTLLGCTPEPVRPSALLIMVDGLRADRVGAYGHLPTETPSIDALAKRGTMFSRAYATSTSPGPARASVLSGHVPPIHGYRVQAGAAPEAPSGWLSGLEATGWTHCSVSVSGMGVEYNASELDKCVSSSSGVVTVGLTLGPSDTIRTLRPRAYDAVVRRADAAVGRVLEVWADAQPEGVVVLTGITGALSGARPEAELLLTDDLLRVPLIVQGPGVSADWAVEHVVSAIDVGPTLVSLLGQLPDTPGVPLLSGQGRPVYHESTLGHQWFGARPIVGFTQELGRYAEGVYGRWYPAGGDTVRAFEDPVSEFSSAASQLSVMRDSFGSERGLPAAAWASDLDPADAVAWAELAAKINQASEKGRARAAHRMYGRLKMAVPDAPILNVLGRALPPDPKMLQEPVEAEQDQP
jgi:hypothetical protein